MMFELSAYRAYLCKLIVNEGVAEGSMGKSSTSCEQCPNPKRKRDATWFREKVLLVEAQGNGKVLTKEELELLAGPGIVEGPATHSVIIHNAAYQANDLDAYDSECDEISTAKAVLMTNFSSYGSDVLSEVSISNNTNNDMLNQSVQEMSYSEPSHFVEHSENEIHSDSNIILYSQYPIETQTTAIQDANSSAQQDALILSVFEQLSNQVTNCNKVNIDNIIANETLSAEMKKLPKNGGKKLLEERQNVDLGTREKLIIDDIIREKNAQFVDFEKEINNQAKNIDIEIALEKKVKELDNIVCKMGQSAQTVHMLVKPQVFYDNNLKQALGFQNPLYLKKAQQIRPMLYDGNVIAKEKETLMLEEESRSKMFLKQSDPMVLEKNVNKLSDEQALHPIIDQSASLPIKFEAPRELPKMEAAVQQYHVDKQCFEIQKKQFLIENDRLLDQIISQDIVNIVVNSSVDVNTSVKVNSSVVMNDSVNYVEMCNKCLELEAELIKQHNMVEKDEYNRLSKRFSELEQHCISLEIAMQLNKEIFQKNNTSVNQTEPSFDQLFELNNLKAELQAKDTTIKKLKAHIKRVNETSTSESVKKDFDEIETINIELEHRVTRLIAENEHLKQTYKQLYDSIKPSRVRAKEQTESLVNQVNQKKLKGKDIVDNATTIAPGMYKLDPIILAPKVKNNRKAHEYYLKHTMEQAIILRELIQELLVNPSTSANGSNPSGNTKNDRIPRTPSSNEKNKVEVQSRKVKFSLNKWKSNSKNVCNEHVKHPVKGAKSLCSVCIECLFDANHVMCLIDHVNSMNVRAKSAFKKNKKRKEWKPTGKVFNSVGYKWKPTGRTFTLVGMSSL
ncbi:hypothetical protein Tco_0708793 [Tanacetum coccineum]